MIRETYSTTTKEQATETAKELVALCRKELGGRWRRQVWKNLGWHCCAIHETDGIYVSVYPSIGRSFHAFIHRQGEGPGGIWAEHGSSPRAAVRNVVKKGRAEVDPKVQVLEGVESFLQKGA